MPTAASARVCKSFAEAHSGENRGAPTCKKWLIFAMHIGVQLCFGWSRDLIGLGGSVHARTAICLRFSPVAVSRKLSRISQRRISRFAHTRQVPLVKVLLGVSLSFVIRYEGKADQSQRSRASFEAGGWMMSHFSSDGSVSPGSMLL